MLDDFKSPQPIAYKILNTSVKKDEFSHAYLFETNNYTDASKLINALVKTLLCPNKYTNREKCGNCHQCEVIESGNFPEIKIINPDGLWIKKDQLKQLQSEFGEKALIGNKRIYIINSAERLNTQAANSMLKFLEEPEEGIIAILQTENAYNMLETIRSRCQIIRLKNTNVKAETPLETLKNILYQNRENREELMGSEDTNTKINKVIEFVNYYENHHLATILYMNKLWHEYIKTKDDLLDAFDVMIMYYKDMLNIKIGQKPEIFIEDNTMTKIINQNRIEDFYKKINIVMTKKQHVKINANTKLLMDKLIIDLEGGV